MNEIAVVFGQERHLAGTLSLPSGNPSQKLAVLLLNSGVIHKIGPHRFNVKLARELTKAGITCLRFDLSGQGDSRVPAQAESFERQAIEDLQAAMDHVERICGIQHFVIAGICSGAHNGLATAQVDPRVVGLWMQDGYVYTTPKTKWVRYRLQLQTRPFNTLRSWVVGGFRRLVQPLASRLRRGTDTRTQLDYGYKSPTREQFANILQALTDRGVRLYLTYTGSMLWSYNYQDQLHDAFSGYSFVKSARCDFIPEVDHTATRLSSQRHLIESIRDWAVAIHI